MLGTGSAGPNSACSEPLRMSANSELATADTVKPSGSSLSTMMDTYDSLELVPIVVLLSDSGGWEEMVEHAKYDWSMSRSRDRAGSRYRGAKSDGRDDTDSPITKVNSALPSDTLPL